MVKFLLVDDHAIVRTGVGLLIKEAYPSSVIDTAYDGESAYEQIMKTEYDVIMLDIHMPNSDVISLVETILTVKPNLKILIFTMGAEGVFAKRFLKLGVMGFLNKDSPDEEVRKAIDKVLHGKKYLSESLSMNLTDDSLNSRSDNPFEDLSNREFEIVIHLIKGKSIGEISEVLNIQNSTVATYKSRILEKLKVTNIIELREMARVYKII